MVVCGGGSFMHDEFRMMSVLQVARAMNVPATRVRTWIECGDLRAIDASGKPNSTRRTWMVDPVDLRAFKDDRSSTPRRQQCCQTAQAVRR
jgi:hypothetical protein